MNNKDYITLYSTFAEEHRGHQENNIGNLPLFQGDD